MRSLALAWVTLSLLMVAGCKDQTELDREAFDGLYKDYSARYHEKMVASTDAASSAQIAAEAARIWDDVFGSQRELLRRRCEQTLADLDDAPEIDESLYLEVARGERQEPDEEQPKGIILKQFVWNPLGAAQMGLNTWLARVLTPESFQKRSIVAANARLIWEAVDRNVDRPTLALRQGPMVFLVSISNQGDYYQLETIRWLRPKSLGPIRVRQPDAPADATPAETLEGAPAVPPDDAADTPAEEGAADNAPQG